MRPRVIVPAVVLLAGVVAVAVLVLAPASTMTRKPRVPEGFVGTMVDGPVFATGVNLQAQLDQMVANGVQSVRVVVAWSQAQPYRSFALVPSAERSQFQDVGGVPTRLSALDRLLEPAAERGISVLPVIEYAPSWAARRPVTGASPPSSPGPYAAFVAALARRYGPHGRFWSAHPAVPAVPIRMWQIWNEPDFASYWSEQPFAPSYVRLLTASRAALRAVDPGAKVVLAGLPDFSWEYLAQIYRVPGAARSFDVAAVHPYTAHPQGVLVILGRVRAVMDQFGDASKPILVTELSWPSSAGKAAPQFGIGTNETLQAERLDQAIPLLAANRVKLGLAGFYWYTWMGDESPARVPYTFNYAGLLKYVAGRVTPKPALGAFSRQARSIEGCGRPVTEAGRCT